MKNIIILFLLLYVKVLFSQTVTEKPRIAVLDFSPKNVSVDTAGMVSDLIRTEIFNTGLFQVVERTEMEKILKEQSFQMAGCTETSCAVEAGRLLSAKKILVGSVGRLGTKYLISGRMVDVELGEIEYAYSVYSQSEEEITQAVKDFVINLSYKYGKKEEENFTYKNSTSQLQKKSSKTSKTFFEFFGGWSTGTLNLKFYSPEGSLTKDSIGVVGSFLDPFISIAWKKLKTSESYPAGFRIGGITDIVDKSFKIGIDPSFEMFYFSRTIVPQKTEFILNDMPYGDFEFKDDKYYKFYCIAYGLNLSFRITPVSFLDLYLSGLGGFSVNISTSDYVMQYNFDSGTPKAPSVLWSPFGGYFGAAGGFRIHFTKHFGLLCEARFISSGAIQERSIDYNSDTDITDTVVSKNIDIVAGFIFR